VRAVAAYTFSCRPDLGRAHPGFLLDRGGLRHFQPSDDEEILHELLEVLRRPHLIERLRVRGRTSGRGNRGVREVAEVVKPADVPLPAELSGPAGSACPALRVAAGAMAIVTGDNDLLAMREFAGIPILTLACSLAVSGMMVICRVSPGVGGWSP